MPEPCKHEHLSYIPLGDMTFCHGCERRWKYGKWGDAPEPAPPREEPTFQGTPLAYGEKLEDGGVSGPRYTVMGAGVAEGREEQPAPPEPDNPWLFDMPEVEKLIQRLPDQDDEARYAEIRRIMEEKHALGLRALLGLHPDATDEYVQAMLKARLEQIRAEQPEPRCGDCRFAAEQEGKPFGGPEVLACRRYPRSPERPCAWPLMHQDDYCGEFSAKEPSR